MTKATKTDTKTITKETTKEVAAVRDTESYEQFVQEAYQLCRGFEQATLAWYWQMGALFSRFLKSAEAKQLGGRTIDHFVKDLRENGDFEYSIGISTLYAAKQIHDRYAFAALGKLIEAGVRVGHLKQLMPLETAQRDEVERQMVGADGKVVSVRKLNDLIAEVRRDDAKSTTTAKIETAAKPTEKSKGKDDKPGRDDEVLFGDGAPSKDTPAITAPEKGEHRAAPTIKDFSIAPRPALERFGKTATACTKAIGDAFIACAEGIKIGFDSPRSQENFMKAVDTAYGDARTLYDALGKLIEQIRETRDDVKSAVDEEKPTRFKPKKKR